MNRTHWITVGGLVAGLGLLLGLGWQFALRPQKLAYEQALKEKADLEAKLKEARARAAQFEKFKSEAENVRRDLDFYLRRLDPNLPQSELYSLLDGIGHSFNFPDWNFSTAERVKSTTAKLDLDQVEVVAKFTSDYETLGQFINLCISQVRLLVPEGLLLTRQVDSEGLYKKTLDAQVTLRVFVSSPKGKGGR